MKPWQAGAAPVLIFALGIAALLAMEYILKRRQPEKIDLAADQGSLKFIANSRNASFLIAIASTFFPLVTLPGSRDCHLLAGSGVIYAGLLLRGWAIAMLGPWFTNVVALQADQKLVTRGPYRHIRHPGYAGGLMFFLGLGIATGSICGLALIMVVMFYAFRRRILVEEKAMLAAFGPEYQAYMQRTKKLIPMIY